MKTADTAPLAPELEVVEWIGANPPASLHDLRGRVVVIEAFQMLCPGCILHGVPQAQTIHRTFPSDQVSVLGLHTVFEHHDAMTPVSLRAFLHEFRVPFPVAVDRPGNGDLPATMAAYGMRGTPTLLLIDRQGRLRAHHFGQVSDMQIGGEIATLLGEA